MKRTFPSIPGRRSLGDATIKVIIMMSAGGGALIGLMESGGLIARSVERERVAVGMR